MKYILGFSILFITLICKAEIFMQQDNNGNILYTDTPLNNSAEKVVLPSTNYVSSNQPESTPSTGAQSNSATAEEAEKSYKVFSIISPTDQQTIQNQPIISVNIKIEPALRLGDKIQIILNGKPWGEARAATHFELTQIERETYEISAVIIDQDQKILKQSNKVVIYVHRTTINLPNRRTPAAPPPATKSS